MLVYEGQRSTLSVSLYPSPVYFGGQRRSLNLVLTDSARLVTQQDPGISLSSPTPLGLGLQAYADSHDFYMSTEDLNSSTLPTEPSFHARTIFSSLISLSICLKKKKKFSWLHKNCCGNGYTGPDPLSKVTLHVSLPSRMVSHSCDTFLSEGTSVARADCTWRQSRKKHKGQLLWPK